MDQNEQEPFSLKKSFNNQLTNTIDKLIKTYQSSAKTESNCSNSQSPPLLLLQTGNEGPQNIDSKSKNEKPLALIQASDLDEMNLVLKSLKDNFPNVNIHLCLNSLNETSVPNSKEDRKSPFVAKPFNLKNSLTAGYVLDKAASIDNSSLDTCIERQESKDSGFWSMSKCSFESTKSLSITDSHSNDAPSAPLAPANSLLIPVRSQQDEKSTLALNSSATPNENDLSRRYLISPTNFSKSPLYNWKKWKKGQAWRYNSSSSNLSQSDCSANNEDSSTRNTSLNYASFDSTTMTQNQTSENDAVERASNPNLIQTHSSSHFSNSFESASTHANVQSSLTIQSSNLNHHLWSSTSKLDKMMSQNSQSIDASNQFSQNNYLTVEKSQLAKAQKRRGKLVRDRTIDNTDDQQSLTSFNNLNLGSNSSNFINQTNNNVKLESTRFDSISSLISPLSISTSKDSISTTTNSNGNPFVNVNGRVSPPEKRVTLNNNNNNNSEIEQHHQSQNINLMMSHLLNKNFNISPVSAGNKSVSKASASSSLSSSPAPTPSSIHDAMNSAAVVAAIAAAITNNNSNNSSNNNPSPSLPQTPPSHNNHQNTTQNNLMNQYDFYKDLQSKLSIRTNENDEANKISASPPVQASLAPSRFSNSNSNLKQVNYLSNQEQQTIKIVSRSNSSPSYSSSFSSIPSQTNVPPQIQYSTPSSSSVYQSTPMPAATAHIHSNIDSFKMSMFSPIQSYNNHVKNHYLNKSMSTCSLPLSQFSQAPLPFSLASSNMKTSAFSPSQDNLNESNNNIKHNCSNAAYFANLNRLVKPPEIVITESKAENEQIDYDQSDNPQSNNANNSNGFTSYNKINKINQENQNYVNIKQENLFNLSSMYSPVHQQQQHQQLNNNNAESAYESIYKKNQENANKNNMYDNWKNIHPFLNQNQSNANSQNKACNSASSSKQVKPHVCPNCQKRFARSDMLIRHSRLHSGVRPYRCNRCGQEFSRSDHLNTHLRTHTGEKPYSCPHPKCTYAACRKDMITRHLKVHTKNRISVSFDNAGTANNLAAEINMKSNKMLSESTGKLIQYPSMSFNSTESINKVEDLKDIKNFEIFNQSKS